ncbi:aminodeoxychorismate synthase component I [Novosphingobium sp.]|uniref:aminodeoxychorismate synthase component I n=1 Tax=Novosphingobium sp. TaxID=1874826 RepID=UPI00286A3E84|nr:aminodeoxychorismate synthase component I [Novosphingobium sp.]
MSEPFILLDDARPEGASAARYYHAPREVVVARQVEEVLPALDRIAALQRDGAQLAGYFAYEAGLALEARLAPLAAPRTGAAGPLVWFGAFDGFEEIAAQDVPAWLAARAQGSAQVGPLDPTLSAGGYARAFAEMQERIAAGDIYQANLTFPLSGSFSGDPLALYAAARPAGSAGYGGVLFDGTHWLLSFSPELFFAERHGAAIAKPMKGTRPRGRDAAEDARLRDELAASVKDRAENLMIVDLIRNDLSRVAEAGSVKVDSPFAVETYPTLHTMVTTVRAKLQDGKGAADMLRALFPCGSITGAPKIRAMELIDTVERDARGPYCGAIGRIDGGGDAAFNVAIRTLRLTPGENQRGRAVLGVGGAIVADSEMMAEWRECLVKGGFVRLVAGGADLIETMRFTPDEGVPLLELHLERIRASAAELGFAFDRHAVRNAIQALCFEADAPARLRLLVARGGAYSLELGALPAPLERPALCVALPIPVDPGDWRLRHKSSDRHFYELGLQAAQGAGGDEALFVRDDGLLTEGCWTSLFVERDGQLLTPPLALGLLPGVLRRSLIEAGRAVEAELTLDDLKDGFLIGNALRGLMPAKLT